jgi:hypothetical protein
MFNDLLPVDRLLRHHLGPDSVAAQVLDAYGGGFIVNMKDAGCARSSACLSWRSAAAQA